MISFLYLLISISNKKFLFPTSFQVTDTNDNPPSFSEPAYSFDIPENAPRGYQVGLISATDPDLGANSMLTYTVISDWANDVFSLNPQTGVFTLTARLDYEEVSNSWFRSFFCCISNNEIASFGWMKNASKKPTNIQLNDWEKSFLPIRTSLWEHLRFPRLFLFISFFLPFRLSQNRRNEIQEDKKNINKFQERLIKD